MKIIIENVLSNASDVAVAFHVSENCVRKKELTATITIPSVGIKPKSGYIKLKRNDTIASVCQRYNVPKSVLQKANEGVEMTGGVTVFIPDFDGISYTVKPLDTLSAISERFGMSEEEITNKNGLEYLYPGLVLDLTPQNR